MHTLTFLLGVATMTMLLTYAFLYARDPRRTTGETMWITNAAVSTLCTLIFTGAAFDRSWLYPDDGQMWNGMSNELAVTLRITIFSTCLVASITGWRQAKRDRAEAEALAAEIRSTLAESPRKKCRNYVASEI